MGKRRKTTQQFTDEAITVHGNKYDYDHVDYKDSKTKVTIVCPDHGPFEQRPNDHLKGVGCPECASSKKRTKKLTTKEFEERGSRVHGNKYDYSKTEYKNTKTKVIITCPVHGDFKQLPNDHLRGRGCSLCGGTNRLTTQQFIDEAREVHGDKYDYHCVDYVNSSTKVTIVCAEHGPFLQKPNSHLRGDGCPGCKAEKIKRTRSLTKDEFEEKAREVHGDKYDYNYVDYKNGKTKVTIVCPQHGPFLQKPNSHLRGDGCPDCGGKKKLTTEKFKERARQVHGDRYNYNHVDYVNAITPVTIICLEHGSFEQQPNKHLAGNGCPGCKAEAISKSKLKTKQKFINDAIDVHGSKYDYSKVDYVHSDEDVEIVCPKHGSFWKKPSKHLAGQGCPECSNENSKGIYGYQWLRENPDKHNDPCLIYLIEMYDDQESFLKLGLTKNSVRERYGSNQARSGYEYEVLLQEETTMKQGIVLEDMVGTELDHRKHSPHKDFSGRTECFSLEAKDLILNHLIHFLFDEQELEREQ